MNTTVEENQEVETTIKSREDAWAKPVGKLKLSDSPADAININVEGRQLTGPLQGFGQLWQKTYRVRLSGIDISPQSVIKTWKERFPTFWPEGNRLFVQLTGIKPGEVGVINLSTPYGMKLSTGIMVIYADDESFSFMNPEGHIFAAMITFSAYEEDDGTVVQIQALVRANDPFYELGCRLGVVHKIEDEFWHATLSNLANHFGLDQPQITQKNMLVDPRVQWKEAKNIWKNAGIRTVLYTPVVILKRIFRR
ncbi:MAG: hypothetical protein PVG14_17190 [Anaerolineales bacterium]|jgi:hypothetical protein